jgi:hypothetical protein
MMDHVRLQSLNCNELREVEIWKWNHGVFKRGVSAGCES